MWYVVASFLAFFAVTLSAADLICPRTMRASAFQLPTDWGGGDPARWQPEAVIANAASARMNEAWRIEGVTDVLVAIPTKLVDSKYGPYGDGQTNSAPTFGDWKSSRPPFVATLIVHRGGELQVELEFDQDWALSQRAFELVYGGKSIVLVAEKQNGRIVATWKNVPKELGWDSPGQTMPVFVRPTPGFTDWFQFYFRLPRHSVDTFLGSVPEAQRVLPGDGKSILDPENLRFPQGGLSPLLSALFHKFPPYRYNVEAYKPDNVHARFGKDGRPTAVGGGYTWVTEKEPRKFMYVGFDGRDVDQEAKFGVPSGSGWHVMGDPITLLNSIEATPMLVGGGFTNPAIRLGQNPPSGGFAYGLSDVVVLRLLFNGEVFVCVPTLNRERDQDHQWYAIPVGPRSRGFLAEEWVHPTRPKGDNPLWE